jgi:ArsR family transcriptional regulator, arsenate/arsenite/antimonite-responsive transcriptional repressor
MDIEGAAEAMSALGSAMRLGIYRRLIRAGERGMNINQLQQETDIPRSTLTHHVHRLIDAGLISTHKRGPSLVCHADYRTMNDLVGYLADECCLDESPEHARQNEGAA